MLNPVPTRLSGLMLFESRVFEDSRGYFVEVYQENRYRELGLNVNFVQDNLSMSHEGVLRGLHFQAPNPQGKLIRVLQGKIWDVAVDVRRGSPTFGEWEGYDLSKDNARAFYIPEGFAHGFVVLEGPALVLYKCTNFWSAGSELTLKYDDPEVAIDWPYAGPLIVSEKDQVGLSFADLPAERLTPYPA